MRIYSQAEASRCLKSAQTNLLRWVQRRQARNIAVPGVNPDGSYTDEFLDYWRAEHASGVTCTGGTAQYRYRRKFEEDHQAAPACVEAAHAEPIITGLTAGSRVPDEKSLWDRYLKVRERDAGKTAQRYSQEIVIPDYRPILVVPISDPHLGNAHCDVALAKHHAELIRDTDGCYTVLDGDIWDNWISPRLQHIQREQPLPFSDELALLQSWIGMMKGKILAAVAGNHDLRTYTAAGLDLLGHLLTDTVCLYDQFEVRFTLRLGEAFWRWKMRHVWTHRSQWNPSHGQEWDSKMADGTWDIAIGGHWHGQATYREFFDHVHDRRKKIILQLGSYEFDSAFARQCGFPRADEPSGAAGLIMYPNGRVRHYDDLDEAVRVLKWERDYAATQRASVSTPPTASSRRRRTRAPRRGRKGARA